MAAIYDAFSDLQGVRQYQELIDLELLKMGAFVAAEMTPHLWAASVEDAGAYGSGAEGFMDKKS